MKIELYQLRGPSVLKVFGLGIFVSLSLLSSEGAFADNLCSKSSAAQDPLFRQDLQKQLEGDDKSFALNRGLGELSLILRFKDGDQSVDLIDDLSRLKESDHVIEGGAGNGFLTADIFKAVVQGYYENSLGATPVKLAPPRSTLVAYKRPQKYDSQVAPEIKAMGFIDRVRYLSGAFIESISTALLTTFGKAKIIIDSVGAVAYSDRVDQVLQKYFDVLDNQGSIHIYFGKMSHLGSLRTSGSDNTISAVILPDGRRVNIIDWLEQIEGIKVLRPSWIGGSITAVRLTKLKSRIKIPELELVQYEVGTPPFRVFKVVSP